MFFRRKRNLFIQNNNNNGKKILIALIIIFIIAAGIFCVIKKDVVLGVFSNKPFLSSLLKKEEKQTDEITLDTVSEIIYDKKSYTFKIAKNDIMNFSSNDIEMYDNYVDCYISLTLPGDYIGCFNKKEIEINDDRIVNLKINNNNENKTEIKIDEKSRYGIDISETDKYYCFSIKNPRDAYKRIVIVDPGHGEIDTGTDSFGYYEKDIALSISKYIEELNRNNREVRIYLSRTEDTLPGLKERAEYANIMKADYFVSVHVNAADESDITGTEVYYYNDKENAIIENKACADIMCRNITEKAGTMPRESKPENFEVIRVAQMPAVLCEIGFITNEKEAKLMGSAEGQKKIAEGIYEGILEVTNKMDKIESDKKTSAK